MEHLLEAQARGYRVESLEQRPRLDQVQAFVLRAARDLAADRTEAGFPFVAVRAWAREAGCGAFWLHELLQEIDAASREGGDG